ncbi:hypothetical protein DF3PB_150010 [uncultured Defluviicoccus sp.]|uniref:Uncharacterized protein n=1 Tax=metagenome TaxID=256318 RepID=A0A380TBJ2_9ZZZZ|nr:hypothetical protein DF3PB_150010 [uncultured Defluviicoccus sp.]
MVEIEKLERRTRQQRVQARLLGRRRQAGETDCAMLRFNYARVCRVTKGRRALLNIRGGANGRICIASRNLPCCDADVPRRC